MSEQIYLDIAKDAEAALRELIDTAHLTAGQLLVIGCSSSEMVGQRIGKHSSMEAALTLRDAILPIVNEHGICLAVQCCEHLNRALVMERSTAEKYGYDPVWVKPQPKAGGSFATACYENFRQPVALEEIRADAGLDIGGTLIGMHLKKVAVPVRLEQRTIGDAMVLAARVRPKFIGGERAYYDEKLKDGYPE